MPPDGPGSTSFVVIRTDWSVLTALRALDATDATHVILAHRGAGGDELHLFQADDIFYELQTHATDAVLTSVLPLAEWPLTPTFAPGETIGDETQAIFLDGGDPVGVVDLEAPGGGYPDPANVQPGDAGGPGGWTDEPVAPPVRRGGGQYAKPPATAGNGGPVAANGGPDTGAGETERSLEAEFPESVVVDTVEWLLVSIVNAAPTDTGLAIDVPAGESIDVLVQPRKGFSVEGDARGTLEVPESGESLPLQFKLKALDKGKGHIKVVAFHLGEPLGVINLEPTVTAAPRSRARGRTTSAACCTQGAGADRTEPADPGPVAVHRGA